MLEHESARLSFFASIPRKKIFEPPLTHPLTTSLWKQLQYMLRRLLKDTHIRSMVILYVHYENPYIRYVRAKYVRTLFIVQTHWNLNFHLHLNI